MTYIFKDNPAQRIYLLTKNMVQCYNSDCVCDHDGINIYDHPLPELRALRDLLNSVDLGKDTIDEEYIVKMPPPFDQQDINKWFAKPINGGCTIKELQHIANDYGIEHVGLKRDILKQKCEQFLQEWQGLLL